MNHQQERLIHAQHAWESEGSNLLRYRWKKMIGACLADFDLGELQGQARLFSNAACLWIDIDETGSAMFKDTIRDVERDMYTVLLFCIAHKAQRDHVLQYLLNFGGLDKLLIQHLGTLTLEISPRWLQDRIIDLMLKTYEVDIATLEQEDANYDVEGFEVGLYPVTQGIYEMIMDENPSSFYGFSHPIENISWIDAILFCNKLSVRFGLEESYKVHEHGVSWIKERNGYRLLSEVEWTIAARAGENHQYSGSDSWEDVAYCGHKEEGKGTRKVAQGSPNAWGLYDCSGNVFEWCWNRFHPTASMDMYGPKSGVTRVRKGGAWNSQSKTCMISYRSDRRPEYFSNNTGFRIARSL